jgi:SAM-dependent methyltransferase
MWSVPVRDAFSPIERFEDDPALRRVLRQSLEVWPTRFSVNASNLRRMLTSFSHTTRVSNFRPTAAKLLYEIFSAPGDAVLDFSAGYGGRLLGCCPLDRCYLGIDPCAAQVAGLRAMEEALRRLAIVRARVEIVEGCAEDVLPEIPDASFSLVFSSPPYFDTERYSDEPTQSYLRYPAYEVWRERFLGRVLKESARVLVPGGWLLVNIADASGLPLIRDVEELADRGLELMTVLRLRLGNKPFRRKIESSDFRREPILVFRKPGGKLRVPRVSRLGQLLFPFEGAVAHVALGGGDGARASERVERLAELPLDAEGAADLVPGEAVAGPEHVDHPME